MSFTEKDGIKNPFLIAMALKAHGDWGAIVKYLKEKVRIPEDHVDQAFSYFKSKGFEAFVFGNEKYPDAFSYMEKPPLAMFTKGDIELLLHKDKDTFGAIITDDLTSEAEGKIREAMQKDKKLIAYFTTDTAKTPLEKDIEKYCLSGKGLMLTESLGAEKTYKKAIARGADILNYFEIPSVKRVKPDKVLDYDQEQEM